MDVTRSPAEYDEVLVMERGPSFPNVPYDVQLKILMYLDARVQMRVQWFIDSTEYVIDFRDHSFERDICHGRTSERWYHLFVVFGHRCKGNSDGLAAGCHDAFGFDKVITSRTRTVIIYAALNTLLEDADGLVTTETPPPPEYTKFPIWEWFKLQQAGVNLQTLVLEMLEIEMACLLENLPATVSRLVLRTCRITYASSVLVDMGDDCCFDVDVPNFEIEIPIHQERPVMTNSKLQEMINVFARPLSHQERMELEEAKTVQQNDFLAAGLNNIIKM